MKKFPLIVATLTTAMALSAHAQLITVTGTSFGQEDLFSSTQTNFTLPYTLQGGSSDSVLAFGFFHDNGNTSTNVTDLSAISFGGVSANGILNIQRLAVAYWFNPTGSNFAGQVTLGVSGREAWSIIELGNVDTSIAPQTNTTVNPATSWSLSTSNANSRILNWIAINNSTTNTVASQSPTDPLILNLLGEVAVESSTTGAFSGLLASGTAEAALVGPYQIGWTPGGASDVGAALVFTAVPEPTTISLVLASLGALYLGMRRRR
jgi:hypothetical protein